MYIAVKPDDIVFQQNTKACNGVLTSPSYTRASDPNLSGAVSYYEVLHKDKEKEEIFEKIRKSNYPNQPSRMGAIFLFPDLLTAKKANKLWWSNKREIHEVIIINGFRVLFADSKWLDCTPENYDQNANYYFQGVMSPDPIVEIVLMGSIQVISKPGDK